ncbi:MAG: GMC family oxidoreductase [Parvibaculaceae bacterium]
MTKFSLDDDRVVVVVGSGAGGGTAADVLCRNGINTVLVEAGRYVDAEDFFQDEAAAYEQLAWKEPRVSAGGWRVAKDFPADPAWQCKVVGGTSVHWTGMALRFQEHELKSRTIYGNVPGADVVDWPIRYEELLPYYEEGERRMGVSGTNGLPNHPTTNHFKVFYHGAKRSGYKQISKGSLAINVDEYDDRPGSAQDGFTINGDRRRAKWSTAYVEVPRALQSGRLDLRTECRAVQIEHDAQGLVSGLVYVGPDGERRRQACAAMIIAGNAIETPRLLLNSTSGRFPNGMANGSGLVGCYYMRHMTSSVWSIFDKPVRMYRGEMMPGLVKDEARHDGGRGFVGGYYIQLLSLSLPAIASSLMPGGWGRDLTWAFERYGSMAGLYGLGEDMPQRGNCIKLHPDRVDQFGVPLAIVHYDEHENDLSMQSHSYKAMQAIHAAAGAVRSYLTPPYPASHNMGTTRMSGDPGLGVVNSWGAAHEVSNLYVADGSVFPTSGAANPTLTIVALALRQAEHISAGLKSGNGSDTHATAH